MYQAHTYAPHQPIFWLVCDRDDPTLHPSLLKHVAQGDYFGTLATILRFLHEGVAKDFSDKAITKTYTLEMLEGMCGDLTHLQNNYEIRKRQER